MPPDHHVPPPPPPGEPDPSIAQRLWRWWQSPSCLALGCLCLAVLAFYHKLWWPSRILVKRDAVMTFLPIKQYMIDRLRSGELPEWFPYDALGRSFIGVAVSGLFHPFTALYFFLPVRDAYRFSVLLSCLLAGAGAFVLGRRLQLSPAGTMLAGIAFACSGYVASVTENLPYLYATCLLPLFLAALDKALSDHMGWLVVPAVLWATVFLNGDIQTGYYFAFAALLWVTMRTRDRLRTAWLKLALVTGLACLLAGVQLGPSLSVFLGSNRRNPSLFQDGQFDWSTWSTHPLRLLTILAWPNSTQADPADVMRIFFGGPTMTSWAESLYLGVPVVGLAVIGLRKRRDLRVLAVLGIATLVLMLGRYGGLYEIFRQVVPFWSAFRTPEKFMGFVSLCTAMLAGAGLDAIREKPTHPAPWLAAALTCMGAGWVLRTDTVQILIADSYHISMELTGDVAGTSATALFVSGTATLGLGLLIAAARQGWMRNTILTIGLLALVTLDLAGANMRAYFTGPRAVAEFLPPLAQAIRAQESTLHPGRFRIMTQLVGTQFLSPALLEDALGVYGASSVHLRHALHALSSSTYQIENLFPWLPGYHPALGTFITSRPSDAAFARFNVAYFIRQRLLPDMAPQSLGKLAPELTESDLVRSRPKSALVVAELPEYDLMLVRNSVPARPRAYLSRRPEQVTAPVAPAVLFERTDFLSGAVDVIETPDALPGPAAAGRADIAHYEPELVVVRTETPAPAVLVLVDAFNPGWRVTLDTGEELPILRANILMRAVVIPAGIHDVTFSYRTPFLTAGVAATAAGILLALALIGAAQFRRVGHQVESKDTAHVPTTVG